MNFKKTKLVLRLLGGDILILILGILCKNINEQYSAYIIQYAYTLLICFGLQVIIRKLSYEDEIFDILSKYLICRIVVDFCITGNMWQCKLSLLVALLEFVWIAKFYMIPRKNMDKIEK